MAFLPAAQADNSTLALETIEYSHHEIHSGSSFFIREFTALPSGTERVLILTTPDTAEWAHFVLEASANAELTITVTEDVTVSGGTAIAAMNRNRNSTATADVTLLHSPTTATGGTVLSTSRVGSGRAVGGESRSLEELVLKQNTSYKFVFANEANTENDINVILNWYEHTDKY